MHCLRGAQPWKDRYRAVHPTEDVGSITHDKQLPKWQVNTEEEEKRESAQVWQAVRKHSFVHCVYLPWYKL
jgi:hypothetical protein